MRPVDGEGRDVGAIRVGKARWHYVGTQRERVDGNSQEARMEEVEDCWCTPRATTATYIRIEIWVAIVAYATHRLLSIRSEAAGGLSIEIPIEEAAKRRRSAAR